MRWNLPRLIVAVLALAPSALAERFEMPSQGLENRIEFWKKVYTQYGENDVIIHDRVHVNLIYDVAAKGEQSSHIAAVQKALDEIRGNLATPENLSPSALQIRDQIMANGVPLTDVALADLMDNVHTQLGIKERFREGLIRSGRYVEHSSRSSSAKDCRPIWRCCRWLNPHLRTGRSPMPALPGSGNSRGRLEGFI